MGAMEEMEGAEMMGEGGIFKGDGWCVGGGERLEGGRVWLL